MGVITTDNPKGAGRKTDLTDELFVEIKRLTLEGKNLREMSKVMEIPEVTIYSWHGNNYNNFRDKVEGWRRDRKLMLANNVIEEMLTMPVMVTRIEGYGEDKEEVVKTEPALVKIKQDTAKFVLETLDKDNYSKRTENTGKDGKDLLPTPLLTYALCDNNSNKKDNGNDEENSDSTRRNVS